jgi:hypothetical protein
MSVSLLPFSIRRHRAAMSIILLLSAGFVLVHRLFGTTPNMAPPSSLKFPASIGYSFIESAKYKKGRKCVRALRDY